MMNMEQQLANLSTLVHSALMSKGAAEIVHKDIEMLRREILGMIEKWLEKCCFCFSNYVDSFEDN